MPDDSPEVAFVSRPVPDPTVRTTEQIDRVVASAMALIHARFDGYDKAILLLQDQANRLPSIATVDADVRHLRELSDERFDSLKKLIEVTNDLNSADLDKAFAASKESSAKSEINANRQMGEVTKRLDLMAGALTDKIEDLKNRTHQTENRITQIESRKEGTVEHQDTSRKDSTLTTAIVVGVIGGLGVLTGLVMAIFAIFHH